MNKNKTKVGIYVRVLTKDKKQDVENQLLQLRNYCCDQSYAIYKEYMDNESGRKGRRERSGFGSLFKDARQRKFDLVLFWSLDLFSREGMAKTIYYLKMLDGYKVKFHSFTEEYLNIDNKFISHILISVLSYLAKLEAKKISERTIAGLERARNNGKKLGKLSKRHLYIDEIVDLKKQGYSNAGISRELGIGINTLKRYLK
jgi:DNA invertase Pin-like site-specific DNA recombinase